MLFLKIHLDGKSDFQKDPDQILHNELALQAVRDLLDEPKTITFEEMEVWLNQHESTFHFIQAQLEPPFPETVQRDKFSWSYEKLNRYYSMVTQLSQHFFLSIEGLDWEEAEDQLLERILRIERIMIRRILNMFIFFKREFASFRIRFTDNQSDRGDQFAKLMFWFTSRQASLVKKHYALSRFELSELEKYSSLINPEIDIRLLSFHLECREKAKAIGLEIEMGLGRFLD